MANVKLCRTKAGKGFKIVFGEEWFYTSIPELMKLVDGGSKACTFRSIDEEKECHPIDQGGFPIVEDVDDDWPDDGEADIMGHLHAFQEHLLKGKSGGQK